MNTATKLNLADGPGFSEVQRAVRSMFKVRKAVRSHFGEAGLSEAAWNLILVLYGFDAAPSAWHVRSLAQRAGVPYRTAARSLAKLQETGFVALSPDQANRRCVRVRLTLKGYEALERSFVDAQYLTSC